MLCTNGHVCPDTVTYCPSCGIDTFHPATFMSSPYALAPVRTTNGLAIASLVLGIVWVYWIGSVLALIFGIVARRQIRETNQQGDGMAVAGIVLGVVGLVILAVFIIVAVAVAHHSTT